MNLKLKPVLISVIIPTRNRGLLLSQTLESVSQQTFPKEEYEVIVVDNGSTDNTVEVIELFRRRPGFNLRAVREDRAGLMFARHAGAVAAASEILLYTDDDVVADPNWVERIYACFADQDTMAAGGRVKPRFDAPVPSWLYQFGDEENCGPLSLIKLEPGISTIESPQYLYGCNLAIRKAILFQVGGFNPDGFPNHLLKYRGDGECGLLDKLYRRAFKIRYDSEAVVYHIIPESRLRKEYFLNRAQREGFSKAYSVLRYAKPQQRMITLLYDISRSIAGILFFKLKKLFNKNQDIRFRYDFLISYLMTRSCHAFDLLKDKELREFVLRENYINNELN
jgi:glucosyl-dolichyl phosphate glucuronosyltransferase